MKLAWVCRLLIRLYLIILLDWIEVGFGLGNVSDNDRIN